MEEETKNINSEDTEISKKTGEDIFSLDKDEPTRIDTINNLHKGKESKTENKNFERTSTPADISKINYNNSEQKKNEAKTAVFNILKYLIPIFFSLIVGLLAIFGGIWAYKLNNIAEPIGGIKVEIENLKNNDEIYRSDIEKLGDRVNNYLENNIK